MLSLMSKWIYNDIKEKGYLVNVENRGQRIEIKDIELNDNSLNIKYKSYNTEHETGGWTTKANFVGDVNEIIGNLNHLIFNVVFLNKRSFEGIKVYKKVTNPK